MKTPIALTVAGSDSSGGAGIQADLKTFARLKTYGLSVITAVTAQSTEGVYGIHPIPPEFVTCQLDAVLSDLPPNAMKTGMLASGGAIEAIAEAIQKRQVSNVVVDPVLVSSSGSPLLPSSAIEQLKRALLPLATIITPNLAEAETLTGQPCTSVSEMENAARKLHDMGAHHVLVKGGHLPGAAVDVFFDGLNFVHVQSPRIEGAVTHGTGCVLSAAITAYLAHGRDPQSAIRLSKEFITEAIRNRRSIGRGAAIMHL